MLFHLGQLGLRGCQFGPAIVAFLAGDLLLRFYLRQGAVDCGFARAQVNRVVSTRWTAKATLHPNANRMLTSTGGTRPGSLSPFNMPLAPLYTERFKQRLGRSDDSQGNFMNNTQANALRRLFAFACDWLIFALWGSLVFAMVMLATGGDPGRLSGPWLAEAVGFFVVTLPLTLYFALCESSRWRATIGKRIVGLRACRRSGEPGEPLSFARALLRNAIKFVPWEFGHMVTQQASFAGDDAFPLWLWGPVVIGMVGPLWWIVSLFVTGDTPYDRWTDARIVRMSKR